MGMGESEFMMCKRIVGEGINGRKPVKRINRVSECIRSRIEGAEREGQNKEMKTLLMLPPLKKFQQGSNVRDIDGHRG